MKVVDPGHVYDMWQLGSDEPQRITYVKRSGGAVQYDEEWAGIQIQENARVMIDRMKYLNEILPCAETENALWHARMIIFEFEARAYRRKQEEVNRLQPAHDDEARPRAWRDHPYDDVPFNEQDIELRPIGPDGHITFSSFWKPCHHPR